MIFLINPTDCDACFQFCIKKNTLVERVLFVGLSEDVLCGFKKFFIDHFDFVLHLIDARRRPGCIFRFLFFVV